MRLLVFALLVSLFTQLKAEECDGITYKTNKLPKECVRQGTCGLRTIFIPRSQGSNAARHIAGWKEYLPGCDGRAWGNISLALEYSHSLKGERLAQYLFGSNCLRFSGSQVPNRGERDLLADNFGLPTTFRGAICFKPRIDNIILDFHYDLGLDAWFHGLYFKINAPLVTTRWDLRPKCNEMNNISSQEAPVFPACYMSNAVAPTAESIKEALSGSFFSALEGREGTERVVLDVDTVFGDMKQPLMFGAFPCKREEKTAVANIDLILGWNFIANECSHAGIYLLTVIPTGNKPHSELVFEPIVGNGNLWEIGPGVSGHIDFVRQGCHVCAFYFDAALTHQFKRFQVRSFDLVGHGPLSRYMLLKEFNKEDDTFVYADNLFNAIDFTTRSTRVGGSAKFDAAFKLSYYYGPWGADIGYNVYARSKEKLRIEDSLFPSDLNSRILGIKGTEGVCYRIFENGKDTGKTASLNSTQNGATIRSAGPVDNPQAINLGPGKTAVTWDNKEAFQSNPPVILGLDNALDITSGAVPHQLTHKFFAHIGYTALDRCWEPQFGIGAEIEFDGRSELLSSLNQWGIWFKGAIAF